MEGESTTFVPADLPGIGDAPERWELRLASPHLKAGKATESLCLGDAEGVVYTALHPVGLTIRSPDTIAATTILTEEGARGHCARVRPSSYP